MKLAVAAVLCASACPAQSKAGPIVYIFSGKGTGSVGASSFNNAPFTLSVYSDTSQIAIVGMYGGQGIYSAEASLATFTISGVGSGAFIQRTRVFSIPGDQGGFGFSLSYDLGGYDL
jgi:hypothetical protein